MTSFQDALQSGYGFDGAAVTLGAALEGADGASRRREVRIPLAMMNRHGLIAGATGTGKTKTLQLLTEQLSAQGVPVFVADIKGDLSGLAAPGESNPRIAERATSIGWDWKAGRRAGRVREPDRPARRAAPRHRRLVRPAAPRQGAGPQRDPDQRALARLQVLRRPGAPAARFRRSPRRAAVPGQRRGEAGARGIRRDGRRPRSGCCSGRWSSWRGRGPRPSSASRSSTSATCCTCTSDGRGVVTCLELSDVQDKPRLFSTFMMWMLAELFQNLPEAGDLDEAEAGVLLRRGPPAVQRGAQARFSSRWSRWSGWSGRRASGSTSSPRRPRTCPSDVLAQLGHRVQHALRAHTPDDDKALRATVRTFPKTEFYDLEETLTSLGIGEAVVTALDPRGVPTPVVATRLIPPASRMAPLTPDELQADIRSSDLLAEYGQVGGPGERAGDAGQANREDGGDGGACRTGQAVWRVQDRQDSRRRAAGESCRDGGADRGTGTGAGDVRADGGQAAADHEAPDDTVVGGGARLVIPA